MSKELFLEIGTEEIPAGFLPVAMADAFQQQLLFGRKLIHAIFVQSLQNFIDAAFLFLLDFGLTPELLAPPALPPSFERTFVGRARFTALLQAHVPL